MVFVFYALKWNPTQTQHRPNIPPTTPHKPIELLGNTKEITNIDEGTGTLNPEHFKFLS